MTVRADDAEAGHGPHEGVKGRWLRAKEIPRAVMSSGCLRNLIVWTGFHGVNEIRELYGVLNEKHWDVVPNDIWNVSAASFASRSVWCFPYRNCPHQYSWRSHARQLLSMSGVGDPDTDLQSCGEPVHISSQIRTPPGSRNRGEAHKCRGPLPLCAEK